MFRKLTLSLRHRAQNLRPPITHTQIYPVNIACVVQKHTDSSRCEHVPWKRDTLFQLPVVSDAASCVPLLRTSVLGAGASRSPILRTSVLGAGGSRRICTDVNELTGADGVVRSPLDPVSTPSDVSLAQYVMEDFQKFGNNIALIDGITHREMSYAELQDTIFRVANALSRLGLGKGDVITIMAPNSIEWAVVFLASIATGAVVSPVNPVYTAGELTRAANYSESKCIITIKGMVEVAKEAKAQCPKVQEIILLDESDGCQSFSSLLANDGRQCPEIGRPISRGEDMATLPYSSGTTGLPKGVMLTHRSITANIQQHRHEKMNPLAPGDVVPAVLPFCYNYGQVTVLMSALRGGATLVSLPSFDPETFLSTVANYRANYLYTVPPMVLFLAKHPLVAKYDLTSVKSLFGGAAPCGPEMIDEALSKLNKNGLFRQGYGLTEFTASHMTTNVPELACHTSCGPAVSNVDFKVIDTETGATVGQGRVGEVCIRGPQMMKGYFKNQEATNKTIIDGFLHSGDIGYYNEKGHLIITDRLKELIKYKGFQVAPVELEALLVTHPDIQDAAVIGKPDEKAGELPRAYVVAAPNKNLKPEDVLQFVKDRVAPYKQLSGGVEMRTEIPKSPSGKILRRLLRDELRSG